MTAVRRAEMARAARDPRRAAPLARLRRLRAARGRPAAAAARGLLRAGRPRRGDRAAGRADPRVPPARAGHLRRERRLPAPGPHQVPRDLGGRLRRGRRPGPLPRHRRPVAAAEAVLLARLLQGPAGRRPRGAAGPRPGVAVRGVAEELDRRPARPGLRVTTRVQCADWFEVRDEALKAHATQIDPTSAVVLRAARDPARDLADRGLRAGALAGRRAGAGGRPVRRHPRARGGERPASDRRVP